MIFFRGISSRQADPKCCVAAAYRVGMEDNIYIAKGKLTLGNGELVAHAKQIVESMGGQVASPDEARALLNLAPRKAAAA